LGKIEAFKHAWSAGWTVFRKTWMFLALVRVAPGARLDDLTITHKITFRK